MKKLTVLVPLFVFVFGLAAGITVTMYDQANALYMCAEGCSGYYECRLDETGPLCTHPWVPYYRYFVPTCSGGPGNCPGTPYFVGCCMEPRDP